MIYDLETSLFLTQFVIFVELSIKTHIPYTQKKNCSFDPSSFPRVTLIYSRWDIVWLVQDTIL